MAQQQNRTFTFTVTFTTDFTAEEAETWVRDALHTGLVVPSVLHDVRLTTEQATVAENAFPVLLEERDDVLRLVHLSEGVRLVIDHPERNTTQIALPAEAGPEDAPSTVTLYVDEHGTLRVGDMTPDICVMVHEYSQVADWLATGHYTAAMIGWDEDGNPLADPCAEWDSEHRAYIPWSFDAASTDYSLWGFLEAD